MISKGDRVERLLEGSWFLAKVQHVDYKEDCVTLQYLDDDNVEDSVPFSEVRKCAKSECKDNDGETKWDDESKENKKNTIKTLLRPLAGLVDDDYEVRNKMQPKVFLHEAQTLDESTDDSIILNGAENRLAAGGGLRALRYLRK
jgi:hypothetical protein